MRNADREPVLPAGQQHIQKRNSAHHVRLTVENRIDETELKILGLIMFDRRKLGDWIATCPVGDGLSIMAPFGSSIGSNLIGEPGPGPFRALPTT